ncbi:ATP-binding cassette sub-family C member 4-like isoform X1 [Bubalus kerabau]|uniref:ATP-binding cassette sub-family C member 4-like isoform X1 n=1 Tax=Bubalus carabanensis TaxID=3119969 RepID=UPI00244E5F50|nr:ATP-binding cassette sub-family C member 4-like isoform X1 [Bubalus carabanensis]
MLANYAWASKIRPGRPQCLLSFGRTEGRLRPTWLNPLFKIGHKRKLEQDDMYSVLPEDRSQHLGEELQGYWDQEVKRAQKDAQEPSLVKAIVKCYWKSYLIWGMFTFLEVKDFHTVHCFLVYVSLY